MITNLVVEELKNRQEEEGPRRRLRKIREEIESITELFIELRGQTQQEKNQALSSFTEYMLKQTNLRKIEKAKGNSNISYINLKGPSPYQLNANEVTQSLIIERIGAAIQDLQNESLVVYNLAFYYLGSLSIPAGDGSLRIGFSDAQTTYRIPGVDSTINDLLDRDDLAYYPTGFSKEFDTLLIEVAHYFDHIIENKSGRTTKEGYRLVKALVLLKLTIEQTKYTISRDPSGNFSADSNDTSTSLGMIQQKPGRNHESEAQLEKITDRLSVPRNELRTLDNGDVVHKNAPSIDTKWLIPDDGYPPIKIIKRPSTPKTGVDVRPATSAKQPSVSKKPKKKKLSAQEREKANKAFFRRGGK